MGKGRGKGRHSKIEGGMPRHPVEQHVEPSVGTPNTGSFHATGAQVLEDGCAGKTLAEVSAAGATNAKIAGGGS
jgi:hypothetical protein